jgi:hypothetical protein
VQTILQIPYLTTGLPIPSLDLHPLLLPLALLRLEYHLFFVTNPVCHKPLVKLTVLLWEYPGGELGN